jgi:hypothetical protein
VGHLCGEVGIENATGHTQVLIRGCDIVKSDIRAGDVDRFAREAIQQVGSGVEPFYPVASWHRGLKQCGADHIIDGVKSALGFTILRRGVWQDIHRMTPLEAKDTWEVALSNSRLLSH